MRMLMLTATIEPSVDMSIFLTKATEMNRHWAVSVLGSFFAFFPVQSFGLEISTPVGVQQIGQHLNLKSTLSNVPEGAESQLRSTCLKAKIRSFERVADSDYSSVSGEVLVQFDPTIRRGGMLEFRSTAPVNDAVIEMELVSECPLIVFTTKWTFIMKQGEWQQDAETFSRPDGAMSTFDPEGSSLLANSRRPPPRQVNHIPMINPHQKDIETPIVQNTEKTVHLAFTPPETEKTGSSKAVEVASLNADFFGAGLIESRKGNSDEPNGIEFDEYPDAKGTSNIIQELLLPLFAGLLVLLLMSWLLYRQYFNKKEEGQSGFNGKGSYPHPEASVPHDLTSIGQEHVTAFSNEATSQLLGSPRVLESLIGNDEQYFDDETGSLTRTLNSNCLDPEHRSSLAISLELINRAGISCWTLPASYLGLVDSRNRALELHRTVDALLLRSQIGLIELAFQDVKQGQLTSAADAEELLLQIMGNQLHQAEYQPALCVPDIVKSHVRAKMCEITGAEKRQLLRENLTQLDTLVLNSALCFNSNAWREFLSEEGILE